MSSRLGDLLASARRRIRWAWCASATADVLPAVLGGLGVVGVAAWLLRRPLPWWIFLAVPMAACVAVLIAGRTRRWSDVEVARAVEVGTDADGVLVSAIEFDDAGDDWHREVHRRAAAIVDDPASARAIPVRYDGRRTAVAAVAALFVAAIGIIAPLGGGAAGARQSPELVAEAEALEELAEVLEEAADESDDEDEADSLDALADELRGLAEEIRSADSPLDAAERLEREAESLAERAGDDLLTDKAAVQGLEQQLAASPLAGGGDAASQLDALAETVAELSDEERNELADRLDGLAQSQSTGNPDLAEQLRTAATELRAGNAAAAGDALNRAAGSQRLARTDVARRDVAATAANAARTGAGRLRNPGQASAAESGDGRQPGNGQGDGDGQGDGNGNGQGNGNGNGEGEGSGSGNGNGQGEGSGNGNGNGSGSGSAGGSPSGQVTGASPSGGQSSGQGGQGTPGQGEATEGTTDVSRAEVFDPVDGGPSAEVDVSIGGGVGEGEVVGRGDSATSEGSAFVPLQDVLGTYLDRAATSLDELDLPPDLRTTVRDYFDHLAES